MACTDEDALICDFAETYGIFNYKSLPLFTAATLAQGLQSESRIMRKLSGFDYSLETVMLASIADRMGQIIWMLSDDGRKKRNRPPAILDQILHREKPKNLTGYTTAGEFESAWKQMVGGNGNGN